MSDWRGQGTPHFGWRSDEYGARHQVEVYRRDWDTVNVSVAIGGVLMGHELTPTQAREMAAALMDVAEQVENDPGPSLPSSRLEDKR